MELPSTRSLSFVGVTIQEDGLFELKSYEGQADDPWVLEVLYMYNNYNGDFIM